MREEVLVARLFIARLTTSLRKKLEVRAEGSRRGFSELGNEMKLTKRSLILLGARAMLPCKPEVPRATAKAARGDVGFVIEFGGVCYQDTYPMYRACIPHVSRMYLDVSRSYTSRYIKIHRDTFVS